MIETEKRKEKYILVGIGEDEESILTSLNELAELVKTAGGEAILKIPQVRENRHPQYYVGTGKVAEIKEQLELTGADGIVCDDELAPSQMNNLERELNVKILDRTLIILDIFAAHAGTAEGSIQVELAALQYRATHLIGMGKVLSRQGGGIGTRGPGEKKLEVDRRRIHDRISQLKAELKVVEKHRAVTRKQRLEGNLMTAAIVGYTNAGKSTLLNTLTDAKILAEDMLFATLDPTTREYKLENGNKILLTDTVGFIRKLPHNLIDAFKSTLEEAVLADIIIHVVDISDPDVDAHMETVYKTLDDLGVKGKTIYTLFNKCEMVSDGLIVKDLRADRTLRISLYEHTGLDELETLLEEAADNGLEMFETVLSYSDAGKLSLIRRYGRIEEENYEEDGIHIKAMVKKNFSL